MRESNAIPIRQQLPPFNPDTNEPNYNFTKLQNALIDQLYPKKLMPGDIQIQLILRIARETWGAQPKRNYWSMKVEQLAKEWKCTRQALMTAWHDAQTRRIVEFAPGSGTGKGRSSLLVRLTTLEDVRDYERSAKPTLEPTHPRIIARQMILFPGKHSGRFKLQIERNGSTHELEMEYHNEYYQPISLAAEVSPDGVLTVVTRPAEKQPVNTQTEASGECPLGTRISVSSPTEQSEPVPAVNEHKAKPAGLLNGEFLAFFAKLRLDAWGIHTDRKARTEAAKIAGDLPPAALENRLRTKWGDHYIASLAKQRPGLLLELIRDAVRDHRASQAAKAVPATKPTEPSFEEWLNSLPPEDRAEAERKRNQEDDER